MTYILFFAAQFLFYVFALALGHRKSFFLISVATAILFSGLRYQTGFDYPPYLSYFNDISSFDVPIEPGFYIFSDLAGRLGLSPYLCFFIFSFVTIALFARVCWASVSPNYSFLLFLMVPGLFLNSFTLIRQFLAISIFVYSIYSLINNKRLLRYILGMFLAASFHYTAIFAFFVGFLACKSENLKPSFFGVISLLLICYIIGLGDTLNHILPMLSQDGKYEVYAIWQDRISNFKILALFFTAVPFIHYASRGVADKYLAVYFKLWVFGLSITYLFASFSPITRLSYYFLFFFIMLVPASLNSCSKIARSLLMLLPLVVYSIGVFSALYTDYSINGYEMEASLWNYRSIFELIFP